MTITNVDFSTEKGVIPSKKEVLLRNMDYFDDLIVNMNWQDALKKLEEDLVILNIFGGVSFRFSSGRI